MAHESTKKTLLIEVEALYNSQDRTRREQANAWLQTFQKTAEAWTITDQLLRDPNITDSARYIAARTLRQKITLDLHQLDAAASISLRDSLLALLYEYRAGPRYIITQICVSLAALALQMSEWRNVLPQITDLYGKNPETINCLLEFLKVLPEEINENKRIPISSEDYHVRSRELLTDSAEQVLQLCLIYLQNSGPNTSDQKRVFEVLLSWLYSGDIAINSLETSPLLEYTFKALDSEELFDTAVDVVCEILLASQDFNDCMPVIEKIYPMLAALSEPLKKAVVEEDEEDNVRGYCRIFTQAGESYLPLVVRHPEAFQSIVEGIGICTAYNDLEIVKITFNFWHRLVDALDYEQNANIPLPFKEIYSNLVDVMIKHLHYPKSLSDWTAEKRDEFREFRHVMGDVLKDCCRVLGSQACLSKAYYKLDQHLRNTANGSTVDWQEIEAPLFSLRAMGSEIEEGENVVLPQIMFLLQQLPDHPKIRYAATLVVARYSFWTKTHPELIDYQLTFITGGFDNDEVAAASALAFKFLCKDCSELLIDYLPRLIPYYFDLIKKLHGMDMLEVTEAVSHVIAAVPLPKLSEPVSLFCHPMAQRLQEIAAKGPAASESEIREACDKIEQIALVLKIIAERREEEKVAENSSGDVHPCIVLIQQMWESKIFDMLFANYAAHKQLSESLARLLKYCVVSYSKDFRPMLPTLMERLITAFGQTALSCYLWVATKCVREHADGEGNPVTLALINFVSRLSTVMFSTLSEAQVNNIPDVIEEYFRLNIACVDVFPATFVQSGILPPTFQAGIECLSIEQPDTLVAVLTFFSKLLSYAMTLKESQQPAVADLTSVNVSSSQPPSEVARHNLVHIETVIRQFGGELTYKLLYGNLYIFPRDFQTDVDSCFKYMVKLLPLESQQWMLDAVQRLPETNLTATEKNKFVMDYNAQIQARDWSRLRRVLNDFTAIYRRRYVTPRRNRGDAL